MIYTIIGALIIIFLNKIIKSNQTYDSDNIKSKTAKKHFIFIAFLLLFALTQKCYGIMAMEVICFNIYSMILNGISIYCANVLLKATLFKKQKTNWKFVLKNSITESIIFNILISICLIVIPKVYLLVSIIGLLIYKFVKMKKKKMFQIALFVVR